MKAFVTVALLLIGGAAFHFTGGTERLGLTQPKDLPETIAAPNATFIGNEYSNPYAK